MKIEGLDTQKRHKDDPMANNFLLISLEEKKARKIAEAINNDTSRKILDYLARKEYTESELSKDLKIPISTVHYNLKQLMEANLVIVDEFHYSSKGKEVNHYKLANKYIIIAPKQSDSKFMDALKKILPLTIITAVVGGGLTIINLLQKAASQTAGNAAEYAPRAMMVTDNAVGGGVASKSLSVARPFLQSEYVAWFFIGALSIIAIYFIYELVKRKN